jgi:hypothetical protein
MANELPTWKSKLMQKPGRLAPVKSVLGAIPIHTLFFGAYPSSKQFDHHHFWSLSTVHTLFWIINQEKNLHLGRAQGFQTTKATEMSIVLGNAFCRPF